MRKGEEYTAYPSRRYDVFVPALTKDHEGNNINTPYPVKAIRQNEGEKRYNNYKESILCKVRTMKEILLNVAPTNTTRDSANKKIDLINLPYPPASKIPILQFQHQQAIKRVEEHLLDEDIEKIVKSKEIDANKFADDMMLSQEDFNTRIDLRSYKESPVAKKVVDYMTIDEDVDAFLRNYMNNKKLHVHPTTSVSSSILNLQQQLYLKMKDDEQVKNAYFPLWISLMYKFEKLTSHVNPCRFDAFWSPDHEDHHDDDARPMGESIAKRKIMSEQTTYTRGESSSQTMDESNLSALVFQSFKRDPNAPSIVLVNKNLFYLKNGNSETWKYVLSRHKIHAFAFPKNDLEELNTRWLRKQIKRFKMYAWNDIEDMYLMCMNGKIKLLRNELLKTLIVFINNNVIWERVHDFQLGLKGYQLKVTLAITTLGNFLGLYILNGEQRSRRRKSLAFKAKKESSDEESSTSRSEDEEYAMEKDKNQKAFVEGSWSDNGEEDDEKAKDKTCLMAHASSEVHLESSYFSDENSSIHDIILDSEYNKLCKMSLTIITKTII
nr:transposase, Ptta/En/Spm, transposase, Tnp1/En/Spm-like protein [Tanacetum cinerariifolium]GEV45822.1 transposase, Ptta/En/Spm, transposase, Tnp1/En/Spm-like protein [Tanacetum cinerariifolium]